jgi:predicted metal-dependent phosphotriesterase family hydrolase
MTAPGWPPETHYPVAAWTDEELIDQYRYVKAEFAGEDSDYLDTDENVADLIQEITRRGLDGIAEAVENDSARVGRDPDEAQPAIPTEG